MTPHVQLAKADTGSQATRKYTPIIVETALNPAPMPSLHLIQNQTDPKLLPKPEQPGADVWISAYWSLAESTVESLVGGRVYFHKAQAKLSFFGGEIVGFRVADEAPYARRIILQFRPDPAAIGVTTGREG